MTYPRLACHGANSGTKALSVVGAMLAGGDSIDDVALLRAGAMPALFDQTLGALNDRDVATQFQAAQRP